MGDLFNDAARSTLNWLAVGASGVVAFMIGAVWYNPKVFGAEWMRLTGVTDAKAKGANLPLVMGGALLLTILIAYSIARLMVRGGGWEGGARVGLLVGAAIAFGTGVNYLFEMKPLKLWLINGGHQLVTSVVIGAILGAWR